MNQRKFIRYWLPTVIVICIINMILVFIECDFIFQIPGIIIVWSMIGIQLFDWKYKFKILN